MNPLTTVIILNFNTKDLLRACLLSFRIQVKVPVCLIVVDNASSDDSASMVRNEFPEVALVCVSENRGFGAGNNAARSLVHTKYVLFLNSDTVLGNDAVAAFETWMEIHPRVKVCGAWLRDAKGRRVLSWGRWPGMLNPVWGPIEKKFLPVWDSCQAKTGRAVAVRGFITGADMFVRRAALDVTDWFDEGFFLYMEDADLQRRIGLRFGQAWIIPEPRILHLEGQSSDSQRRSLWYAASEDIWLARYLSTREAWWYRVLRLIKMMIKNRRGLFDQLQNYPLHPRKVP